MEASIIVANLFVCLFVTSQQPSGPVAPKKKNEQIPLFLPLRPHWRPCSGEITIAHIEGIVVYSSAARDYIPAAVPSGAAQEAFYPAGTLGESLEAAKAKNCKTLSAGGRNSRPLPGRPAAAARISRLQLRKKKKN